MVTLYISRHGGARIVSLTGYRQRPGAFTTTRCVA